MDNPPSPLTDPLAAATATDGPTNVVPNDHEAIEASEAPVAPGPKKFSQTVIDTALFEACVQGNEVHVEVLLSTFGANPNHRTASGINALHAAALEGRTGIVKSGLSHGAMFDTTGCW